MTIQRLSVATAGFRGGSDTAVLRRLSIATRGLRSTAFIVITPPVVVDPVFPLLSPGNFYVMRAHGHPDDPIKTQHRDMLLDAGFTILAENNRAGQTEFLGYGSITAKRALGQRKFTLPHWTARLQKGTVIDLHLMTKWPPNMIVEFGDPRTLPGG